MNTGQVIIYQTSDGSTALDVRLEKDTIWINRQQMAELFDRDIKTIGKHINNALKEELSDIPVVAKFATTANDGKTYQMVKILQYQKIFFAILLCTQLVRLVAFYSQRRSLHRLISSSCHQ